MLYHNIFYFFFFMYLAANLQDKYYLEMSSSKAGCHQWHILILSERVRGTTPPCAHMKGTHTLKDYFPIKVVNSFHWSSYWSHSIFEILTNGISPWHFFSSPFRLHECVVNILNHAQLWVCIQLFRLYMSSPGSPWIMQCDSPEKGFNNKRKWSCLRDFGTQKPWP